MKIHPVIHISNLKPFHPDSDDKSRNKSFRPLVMMSNPVDKEVEKILAERTCWVGNPRRNVQEFLVKWKGLPNAEISC